jgi:hypothetical protein
VAEQAVHRVACLGQRIRDARKGEQRCQRIVDHGLDASAIPTQTRPKERFRKA